MKKTKKAHSLHLRLWAYFLILAIVIMVLIWFLQIVFIRTYYETMKRNQILSYGDQISASFNREREVNEDFKNSLYYFSSDNDIDIRIFSDNGEMIYSSEMYMFHYEENINNTAAGDSVGENRQYPRLGIYRRGEPGHKPPPSFVVEYDEIFQEAGSGEKEFVLKETKDPFNNSNMIMYTRCLNAKNGENYYLTISSILAPIDATSKILHTQFIIITLISLISAFLLSYFFAKRLAKPIVKMTKTAKKLAKGDYGVEFEGSNYTEIDELAQVMNTTTKELAKTDRLRRDLIANVSHDLRTPMTIIKSYAEMIRDLSGGNPEKREAHTQVIIDEADRLTTLVNDILDLSKLEAGTAKLEPVEFNISRNLKEIVNRFQVFSETQGYNFITDIEDELYVEADEHAIAQVIYNLISNAVNFTGHDKKVYISLKKEDESVRFTVRDTGMGIPPDELETVWKRYYRASESHKRTKIGTGIGLSIVKGVLDKHGAKYGVRSAMGAGSTFWFELKAR